MNWSWIVLLPWIHNCAGVVYFLNETEYDRLPRLFELDEYESCLRQGTYCTAKFDIEGSHNESLMQLIREYSEHTSKHFNYSYIHRGVCVTQRCKEFIRNQDMRRTEDVEAILGACMNASLIKKYGLYSRLQHVYSCDTREVHDETNNADWLVAALLLLCFGACVVGSLYDIIVTTEDFAANEKRKVNKYLLSFSIFCNLRWLIHDDKTQIIRSFYGLKFFKTLCVVFAHVSLLIGATFLSNPHDKELAYEKLALHIVFNGLTTVQAFFIISGILLTFKLEAYREHNPMSWRLIFILILERWWRLVPACAAMIAVSATWLRYLGSGPLWKMLVTEKIVKDCRKYWWQYLFFINNYSSDNKYCVLQTWHVAVEFQLWCIAVVMYVLMANRTKLRNLIIGLFLLIGIGGPAMHVWLYDYDPQVILSPELYRNLLVNTDTFHHAHVYVHNNFTCYFMGMLFGQLAYHLQKDGWKFSPKSKIMDSAASCLGWLSIAAVLVIFACGKILYADVPRPSIQFRMFYAAVQRPLYGLCMLLCIFMVLFRRNDKFKAFLEWDLWTIPSRLSYCVYIVHFPILHVYAGSRQALTYFSLWDEIVVFFGIVIISYILGLILFLLVESPTTRCFKLAMTDYKNKLKEE